MPTTTISTKTMSTTNLIQSREEVPLDRKEESVCCIVGGGPAGAMLALLLARRGVRVTLLEAHKDFDREFRGDTVHPSTLEILDQLGLAERLHQLRHARVYGPTVQTSNGPFTPFDLRRLKTKFPYIMLIPQSVFLDFITTEARKHPVFRLVMRANVQGLIEEQGTVRGVSYQSPEGWHEVRAAVTIGADGRFSMVRHLAGIEPIPTAPPMDVLWFRLPRLPEDPVLAGGAAGAIGRGHILIVLDRYDYWQCGYVIPKGDFQKVRAAGMEALRGGAAGLDGRFSKHLEYLTKWRQVSLLSVESSRCSQWYRPGLLLIGDAAHAMSPVGGVGINYAIQDAVVAANVLTGPLLSGRVEDEDLAEVQKQRELPTRFIQAVQTFAQNWIVSPALRSAGALKIPTVVRLGFNLPIIGDIPARIIGFGIRRPRLEE